MTEEEIKKELEELQSHPMFMTEIPENAEDNKYLAALQAIKFEGSPSEVAKEFLQKSKESLESYKQTKKFIDLKQSMYYICNAIDHVKDDGTVPDIIKFDLYYWRAGIQLMVNNIGYALEDLKSALFYNENDQAYFMLIKCYKKQEAYNKALKLIATRKSKLENDSNTDQEIINKYNLYNKKISNLQSQLVDRLKKLEIFKNMEKEEKLKLYDELTRHGIKLKPQIHNIPANYEAKIYVDQFHKFHFPILIIYEEFNSTDYIQDVEDSILISEILDILFSESSQLPWDKENKYNTNTCTCFYEISEFDPILKKESNYYYPLRNDDKLIDILKNKRVFMNGFPVLVVVSQLSNFYQHFLKNKIVIKRK